MRLQPRTDIQAILTVLGRRTPPDDQPEPASLDLQDTDLRRASLAGADLRRANLVRANLAEANLRGACLQKAILRGATLQGTRFPEARLEDAIFDSTNLKRADLSRAHLERATFEGAHLSGASFDGTYLDGADLTLSIDLTPEQVWMAHEHAKGAQPEWSIEGMRERYRLADADHDIPVDSEGDADTLSAVAEGPRRTATAAPPQEGDPASTTPTTPCAAESGTPPMAPTSPGPTPSPP